MSKPWRRREVKVGAGRAYEVVRRPVITEKGEPPADAKEWEGKPGKTALLER